MYRVTRDNDVLLVETAILTTAMNWLIAKVSEYDASYTTWFESVGCLIAVNVGGGVTTYMIKRV